MYGTSFQNILTHICFNLIKIEFILRCCPNLVFSDDASSVCNVPILLII